ncbi:MAG: N-acetylglucosaminyl-diphospho-decaprenol L-rhamnosyltransferase [Candidatus Marinimicrobia bacterium]|nr:N-acetylglucosaminyl-diphospho-decaprenol L-rhamnosyltransferase [Candidatus Neomarinimicrobiota bacterium]
MQLTLSIVIVTYNSQEYIGDCLQSISSYSDSFSKEIIIVDNNSADDTLEEVRAFRSNTANLRIIANESNRYFAPALSQGLHEATGEYVFILNPDTKVAPGTLEKLTEFYQTEEQVGVVAPQLLNTDRTIQPSCRRFPRHRDVVFNIFGINKVASNSALFNGWKMGDFDHRETREVDQPQGAALFTSRMVLESVGYFDEDFPMFFNDVDWCFRVKQAGFRIVFFPEAKVTHIKGASVNSYKALMVVFSHVGFFRFFEKHYNRIHHQLLNLLIGLLLYGSIPVRVIMVWIRRVLNNG